MNPEQIKELDLQPYRVDTPFEEMEPDDAASQYEMPTFPRSVRVSARGAKESINTVFTIHQYPLLIGRKACHVELSEAELSLRHCSIFLRGETLYVRDANSHMGTFLDGQQIDEAELTDGVHVLRVGTALVTIETVEESGKFVEPISLDASDVTDESELAEKMKARAAQTAPSRSLLVCVEGALKGQEFEIPSAGLVVGREGHVRVPDEFLSRKHFEVLRDEEGIVRVRDLGSRNGTFLNTLPARNTKVQAGDEIRAGVNVFRIEQRA
jgi:pSer/pThr/pTyr-binding forkhead associated (FHA) protein